MKNSARFLSIAGTLCILTFSFVGCSSGEIEFTINNDSQTDREDEPIVITRQQIEEKGSIPNNQVPLPYLNEEALPAQVDDIDSDGSWDELAFTINLASEENATINIRFVNAADYPEFTSRTNVRFGVLEDSGVRAVEELTMTADELPVPLFERFQMDGPAWENDKIGFRQYIDGRNGRDLYGKTSPEMALDTVGLSDDGKLVDNYHVMLPWGRDILAVGNSLGLGGLALLENSTPTRLGIRLDASRNNIDTTKYQLITEGPVRSVFRLTYTGWNVGDRKLNLTNEVSIWAGKYGHANKVQLTNSESADTLIVGLVNIHNDNPPELLEDQASGLSAFLTHDQQTYDKEWFLGMALIFPNESFLEYRKAPESGLGITNSYFTLFEMEEEQTLEYHVFAGWELSDERFTDAEYFREFITEEMQKIAEPLQIQ
ncbi:MAG: DUF4861 domain-containing protein [Balneolaceae bacterium]